MKNKLKKKKRKRSNNNTTHKHTFIPKFILRENNTNNKMEGKEQKDVKTKEKCSPHNSSDS